MNDTNVLVREYYGKILSSNKDLKTTACCSPQAMPALHQSILKKIDPEIKNRFYGCGSPIPQEIEGKIVLDLGCGTGRDVYMCAYLVGEKGTVIGVDMTDEQLAVAKSHTKTQMKSFGFKRTNVIFKKGDMEDLESLGIETNSVDVVISNCAINLSPNKKAAFSEIFRVLTQGGELYFSDVFADRRIPPELKNDPIFYGECLGGAMYIEDFRRILAELGCPDFRIVKQSSITLDPELQKRAGMITFYSLTIRAFKLKSMEDKCEDYGQVAIYQGTFPESPSVFFLDANHSFEKGKPMLVCGNTASMLAKTRFSKHFEIMGDRSLHYGAFDCKDQSVQNQNDPKNRSCC